MAGSPRNHTLHSSGNSSARLCNSSRLRLTCGRAESQSESQHHSHASKSATACESDYPCSARAENIHRAPRSSPSLADRLHITSCRVGEIVPALRRKETELETE